MIEADKPRALNYSSGSCEEVHTLHSTPYTLHPAPYTPHPTPKTQDPTSYTPHPTPYTLHPTPYTPHLSPHTQRERRIERDRALNYSSGSCEEVHPILPVNPIFPVPHPTRILTACLGRPPIPPPPPSSEFGTHRTVTASFWPWLEPFSVHFSSKTF